MKRLFAMTGGVMFIASLLYFAVSFDWRFSGTGGPWSIAVARRPIVIDILLFSGFALHHSAFARLGLKRWVARVAAASLERSIYVWIASLSFFLVCALWQPVPGVLWTLSGLTAVGLLSAQAIAAVLAVTSASRLDVLELAGIRQVLGEPSADVHGVDERGPYAFVRHPIYLGWFGLVWLTPTMNGTRLVFAVVSSAY